MTVTDNQLILAAVCGIAGISAAYIPFFGVMTKYLGNDKHSDDGNSIWMFLVVSMGVQFFVSVLFYYAILILDSVNKIAGMKLRGADGAFDLFWKVPIIESTTSAQMWTSTIEFIRSMTITINAFTPLIAVLGGAALGYAIAAKQHNHTNESTGDFMGYGVKMFLGAFVAAVVYVGWAQMASYTMQIPSAIEGKNTTLIEAAQSWWRKSLGVKNGNAAAVIKF